MKGDEEEGGCEERKGRRPGGGAGIRRRDLGEVGSREDEDRGAGGGGGMRVLVSRKV